MGQFADFDKLSLPCRKKSANCPSDSVNWAYTPEYGTVCRNPAYRIRQIVPTLPSLPKKNRQTVPRNRQTGHIPGSGTFRHQPFGRQYGVGHMGDKSVDQMG